jgi:hypothetical protein
MNKFAIFGAAMALSASAASAQDVNFFGSAEYAVEADAFEVGVGADVVFNDWTITPALYADRVNDVNDVNRAELTVAYAVNDNWSAYVTVETDRELDYAETTIGTRLEF